GDTLFCGGYGRTDLPGGSEEALFKSITTKLLVLPGDTLIYPGHGPSSTIGQERRFFW
ncbi:MAG: MBL fold metallo-hydrolase, partial [Candidatus Omnitrophica bacterium]|nr:MBL fold metallo-hydrolase [Candidatus Omnitrophota bacterium]